MSDRSTWNAIVPLIVSVAMTGCTDEAREAFNDSKHGVRIGMTLGEVLDSGVADYLISAGPKNVAGATVTKHQPVSENCRRHVLDISYSSRFSVRVYCGQNEPSARIVMPERLYTNKQQLVRALDDIYGPVARNMEFRIESPPRHIFGVFEYFLVRTGPDGRVSYVSELYRARETTGP